MNPAPVNLAPYYKILGVSTGATLEEVDQRYFELVCIWGVPSHSGDPEFANIQMRTIDHAYTEVLRHLMLARRRKRSHLARLTYKQVMTGQDRMTVPVSKETEREDLWIYRDTPPRPAPPDPNAIVPAPGFSIRYVKGNVLEGIPERAVIVHAVSCQGVWGTGMALQLRNQFPSAYKIYRDHCKKATKPADLVGSCLLISPQWDDYMTKSHETPIATRKEAQNEAKDDENITAYPLGYWIACLFTSVGYGKKNMQRNNPGRDTTAKILYNTQCALESLRTQLEEFTPSNFNKDTWWQTDEEKPGEIRSCKFNSGAFGVSWDDTEELIEDEFAGFERPWFVFDNHIQKGD